MKKHCVGTTYYAPVAKKMAKCLISYYGITNETCWYPSKIESAEADVQDTLGNADTLGCLLPTVCAPLS